MNGRPKRIYLNIFIPLCLCALITYNRPRQENHPPVVKIVSPKNNSLFEFDTQLTYQINVADKEDGDSKYDEINAKEVLLEVRYIKDRAKIPALLRQGIQPDAPGLAILRTSNCFNCHNFNSKSIGPSFFEISGRYPATKAAVDSLVKHVSKGSSGIWGKEKMPSHPELTDEQLKSTINWILKNPASSNVNYYIGLTGSFRIIRPAAAGKNGAYLLTASYTDHGLKDAQGKGRLKGRDAVVITGK